MGGRNRWTRSKVAPFDFTNWYKEVAFIQSIDYPEYTGAETLIFLLIKHYGVNQLERCFKEMFKECPNGLDDLSLESLDWYFRTKGLCKIIHNRIKNNCVSPV